MKSRQHGFTTNACIDGLDDALFNKNFKFTIIADTLEHAVEIFEKVKTAWKFFPLQALYRVNSDTARQFAFSNNSIVRVTTSARSATVNRLHISELGAIAETEPKKAKEIINGSIPAVPKNGRVDIESTMKGESGLFYKMVVKTMNQKKVESPIDFKFHFFGWLEDDDCQLEGDIDVPRDLQKYQKLHNISDEQIRWYYQQSKVVENIKQEYPTYAEEALIYSGVKFFDQGVLSEYAKNAKQGETEGEWTYFERPRVGHRYGLGADVAEGIGQDSNTAVIWDFTPITPIVVAEYANNKIGPDLFAYEIKNGAEKYKMALCAVERNNPGHATLTELKKIYPVENIFFETRIDRKTDETTKRIGWNTTLTTKPKMLYDLRTAVHDRLIEISSKRLLTEMRTYDQRDLQTVKFDEEQTQHWDLLIAAAIGFQMRNHLQQTETRVSTYRPQWDTSGRRK